MTLTEEKETALMLIDFQRDFLEDGGRMPVARNQVEPLLNAARAALEEAKALGLPIVAVGNEFRPNDYLMNILRRFAAIAGSRGAEWDPRLPLEGAVYFPKWGGSAFGNAALEPWLKEQGVRTLVLTGLMAHACVTATAKGAIARGFGVCLIEAAVAGPSDHARSAALAQLKKRGVKAISGLQAEMT